MTSEKEIVGYYWSKHNWMTCFFGILYWFITFEYLRRPFKEWKFRWDLIGWLSPIPIEQKLKGKE